MEADTEIRKQHQRDAILRDRMRKAFDMAYDTDAALIVRRNPFFPRFNGHTVAQQSLDYAILLLMSDDRTYGTDDAGEANRIIRRILDHQDLRPKSDTFGNFFWMTHWDRVKDKNAVSFLTIGLVFTYVNFQDKLEDNTKAALERAFPNVLLGIRGHKVRWQYTNIYFLNLGGLVGLARVLDDPSIHAEAVADFNTWVEGTSEDGFHEFNSPTYTPVTLSGMEAAWAYTSDGEFKDRLRRTMDLITYQMALNLMPGGFLAGAAARAYQGDTLNGSIGAASYAHVKFGTPAPAEPAALKSSLFDYVPPEPVRSLANEMADGTEIHDRGISLGSRRTHVITQAYGLASQSLQSVGGHSPPSYILLARNSKAPRPSVPFLPDESFTHQPCATFLSRQNGSQVIGRLYYDLQEEQRSKFLDDPTFICEPRVLFGLRDQIESVRIGNVDWGGKPVSLLPGQSVAVSYGDIYLGVVVLLLDCDGQGIRSRATLAYGEDGELRLRVRLHGGEDVQQEDNPLVALLYVEVQVPEESHPLETFADRLSGWQLSDRSDGETVSFLAEHEDGATIAYPYTEADPDPMGDALHLSPGLALQPGDFVKLVNGEKPLLFDDLQ